MSYYRLKKDVPTNKVRFVVTCNYCKVSACFQLTRSQILWNRTHKAGWASECVGVLKNGNPLVYNVCPVCRKVKG